MINHLLMKVTPSKATPAADQPPKDDAMEIDKDTGKTPEEKHPVQPSYAEISKRSSVIGTSDAPTKDKSTNNDAVSDQTEGKDTNHHSIFNLNENQTPVKTNKKLNPTKPNGNRKVNNGKARKTANASRNKNKPTPSKPAPKTASKPASKHTTKNNNSPSKNPGSPAKNTGKVQQSTVSNDEIALKPWLDGKTIRYLQISPHGIPRNLATEDGEWMQGFDICAAGIKCCARESISLTVKNRCASCGWCMHEQCGIKIKQTKGHAKDEIFKPTKTVHSICLLCIHKKGMKIDKPGTPAECLSTQHTKVSSNIKMQWSSIKLGRYNVFDPNHSAATTTSMDLEISDKESSQGKEESTNTEHQIHPTNLYSIIDLASDTPMETVDETKTEEDQNMQVDQNKRRTQTGNEAAKLTIEVNDSVHHDDATVVGANKSSKTETTGLFMDLQVMLPAAKPDASADKTTTSSLIILSTRLREWFEEIQSVEPSFRLLNVNPEAEEQSMLHISNNQDWKRLSKIKKFFRAVKPKKEGGRLYTRIRASFHGTPADLLTNVGWFHQERNEFFTIASLQCFQSSVVGFLLYSLRHTDPKPLIEAIKLKCDKPVAMRWMRIADGSKYDPKRDTSEDPRALHIECAAPDLDEVKDTIRTLWGSTATQFPLGTHYRFVSQHNSLLDTGSITKFESLLNRQAAWIAQHGGIMRDDIYGIDTLIPDTNFTLRQALMNIPTTTGNTSTPLIYAIDRRWNRIGYNFSFHPDKYEEGCRAVKGLVTILLHKYTEEQIRGFFSPRAMIEGKRMEYNEATGAITSADDKEIFSIFEADDEMSTLHSTPTPKETEIEKHRAETFGQRNAIALTRERTPDDDSISTLEGTGTHRTTRPYIFNYAPDNAPAPAPSVEVPKTQRATPQENADNHSTTWYNQEEESRTHSSLPQPLLAHLRYREDKTTSGQQPTQRATLTRQMVKPQSAVSERLTPDRPPDMDTLTNRSDLESDSLDELSDTPADHDTPNISATPKPHYNKQLIYGDTISPKLDNILRIGFQNFGGLTAKNNDPVDNSLRKWITDQDFDIFGISEVNMYWPRVKPSLQFLDRVYSWFNPLQTRARCVYNRTEHRIKRSVRQYGGTAQIARGNAALRHNGNEDDPTGLGRWTSQQFLGKDQRSLRVITAYRPVSTSTAKIYSPYRQQWAAFRQEGRELDPREAFLDVLSERILTWKKSGEQIILMCDMNDDVRSPRIQQFLQDTGMREVLLEKHGQHVAPRTFIRRRNPIDGIFATEALEMVVGGYCAFDEGVQGSRADHRCLWIDISLHTVFGHKMPGPTKFAGRRVNGKDPRTYATFRDNYRTCIESHGLSKRIFALERAAVYPLPPHLRKEAETISRLRYEALEAADHKCRQLHFGGASYTPEFRQLECTVKTLDLLLKKRGKGKVNSALIRRQHKQSKMQESLTALYSLPLQALKTKATNAYKRYRRYWINQDIARDTWLEELAKARAQAEMNNKPERPPKRARKTKTKTSAQRTLAQIKALRLEEKNRRLWARIKRGVGKNNLAGISMIIAPDETGNWVPLTRHEDITTALIAEHSRKYHQTENTPPMKTPLIQQIGYLGTGQVADQILEGQYNPRPGTDPAAASLLRHLSKVEPDWPDLPLGISTKDYQNGWKAMRERTLAGGNTLHFGHCKAIAQDDDLSAMEAAFISIPLRSGYAYQAWEHGIDCVLPKKKNEIKVSALRTIVLLEADFNFLNKHIARKVMIRAELAQQGIAPEQYGSRKFFRAIDHVLNKVWSCDILRQFKQPGVIIPTDLKSCYDRICHSIASLCLRRQGVAEPEVVCMFSTLQRLKHTIRCAFGTSSNSYGDERWAVPMQGVYQGNGAGPAIWAVVSSPVLQILRKEGFGAFFKAAISGEEVRLVGYAFVDDTDLIQTGATPQTEYKHVLAQAQCALDRWEGLIRATGGALAVSKCRWWAIDFEWAEDGSWQYRQDVELPGTLKVRDFDDHMKTVKRLSTEEAYETLGVFVAPTGNHEVEYKYLLGKAQKWADRLRSAPLQDHESATALRATILKTLEYPLPALFLSKEECNKLMSVVLTAALPKARFNRHSCRKTLYGPGSHGGLEIPNLHTSQLIAHVDTVIRHGPAPTISGQQFRATLQVAKLELGLPGPLFSHSYKKVGHLITDSWIKSAWREFEEASLDVQEQTNNLRLRRKGDIFLMAQFIQSGYTGITLARLNRCRIRLKVVTQADITSGDGRCILHEALFDHFPCPNMTYEWPNQGPLPPSSWRLWRRALKKAFPTNPEGKLHIPLGRWIPESNPQPTAYHDPTTATTYVRRPLSWLQYKHDPIQFNTTESYTFQGATHQLPAAARPAVAWISRGNLTFHGSAPNLSRVERNYNTLTDAIEDLEDEWCWAIEHIEWSISPEILAHEIRTGQARAIADGSFKHQKGTAGFAIVDHTCKRGIYCMQRTPGPTYSHCSYRSENGGIVGILLLLRLLDQTYSLKDGNLTIGCDNLESGRRCLQHNDPAKPTEDHYDILAAARELRSLLPFSPKYQHVEGHQRTKYPQRQLDDWAVLNEDMDALAKAYWRHTETQPSPFHCRPKEWIVTFKGQRIVTNFSRRLRRMIEGQRLEDKWTSSSGTRKRPIAPQMKPAQIRHIDLHTIQKAWDNTHMQCQRFVTKFISRQLPTGRRMEQFQFGKSSNCPLCGCTDETTEHVFLCRDNRAITARGQAIVQFEQLLKRLGTATDIRLSLLMLLKSRLLQEPLDRQTIFRKEVRILIGRQLHIHPFSLLHGRLCKGWSEAQQNAYRNYSPWKTGQTWATTLIHGLWELSSTIWNHRNNILHEKEDNHPDVDPDAIDMAILEEWAMGPDLTWELSGQSLFKGHTCETLLAKPLHQRMQWLYYVQLARRPTQPSHKP